jgi:hypothetical protein
VQLVDQRAVIQQRAGKRRREIDSLTGDVDRRGHRSDVRHVVRLLFVGVAQQHLGHAIVAPGGALGFDHVIGWAVPAPALAGYVVVGAETKHVARQIVLLESTIDAVAKPSGRKSSVGLTRDCVALSVW